MFTGYVRSLGLRAGLYLDRTVAARLRTDSHGYTDFRRPLVNEYRVVTQAVSAWCARIRFRVADMILPGAGSWPPSSRGSESTSRRAVSRAVCRLARSRSRILLGVSRNVSGASGRRSIGYRRRWRIRHRLESLARDAGCRPAGSYLQDGCSERPRFL